MADEKKYTAQEAARAVLAKVGEVLKKSEKLVVDQARADGGVKSADKKADKDAGMKKGEMPPKSEKATPDAEPKSDKAFEAKPGHSKEGDPRMSEQKAPEANPKENAEGNNEKAGTTPTQVGEDQKNKPGFDEMNGLMKLAKFMGRMEHKKSKKVEA